MASDDPVLSNLVAEDIDGADAELGAFRYVIHEVDESGLVAEIKGSEANLGVDESLPAINFENALSISSGNDGVDGDIARAEL